MRAHNTITRPASDLALWRAALAGLCASLVGIGLARFAYTPLIPALVEQNWFSASEAGYLGAANLAGYLAGALAAQRMTTFATPAVVLRAMMLLAVASFFASAWPLWFWWFSLWRFAAGVAGGALMVLAAPTILPHVPTSRRGVVAGAIFTGVGLGIVVAGVLVPLLLAAGLTQTWLGLGALSLLLTLIGWGGWPRTWVPSVMSRPTAKAGPQLKALYAVYGLNAIGLVPHMVFLVDFVARALGQGIDVGARYWVVFGIGATLGPLAAGALADRIGFGRAMRVALVLQAVAVMLPALLDQAAALVVSSLIIGAATSGVVPLALGRVQELVPDDLQRQRAAWSIATTVFALALAGAAYGFAFLLGATGSYALLFLLGGAPFVAALAIDVMVKRRN